MTPPGCYDQFKICPVCQVKFFRKRGGRETQQVWDARITCSRPCASIHNSTRAGRRELPRSRREPTFRDEVPDWRNQALCRGFDPEIWFPVGTSGPAVLQIAEAKAVCRECPVVAECGTWALESGQDAGIWGGLDEDERRALKRRNTRSRARAS